MAIANTKKIYNNNNKITREKVTKSYESANFIFFFLSFFWPQVL